MSWESWERRANAGPVVFSIFLGLAIVCVGCVFGFIGCVGKWVGNAEQTAFKEFSLEALLRKYEWFKDAAAQLDAKRASIEVYKKRFDELKAAYAGKPRSEWSRADAEQSNLWSQELAGIRGSYNGLAAEYNSAMSKANYQFCNVGTLPKGASVVLPREYRTYLED